MNATTKRVKSIKYYVFKRNKTTVIKYSGRNWSLRITPSLKYIITNLFR